MSLNYTRREIEEGALGAENLAVGSRSEIMRVLSDSFVPPPLSSFLSLYLCWLLTGHKIIILVLRAKEEGEGIRAEHGTD